MTRRTPNADLVEKDYLEIHPEDALTYGMGENELVTVSSRYGEIEVTATLSERVAPGTLFLTFHFPETHTNRLNGPVLDPMSSCPQNKATAVKISNTPN